MQEYEYNKRAMGTDVSISIITNVKADARIGSNYAFETIQMYEKCFSRFLPESELSCLNTVKKAVVSSLFLEVLTEILEISTATEQVCNPLIQIVRFGYQTSFDDLEGVQKSTLHEPYNIDTSSIHIQPNTRTVTLQEGQKLDFGGFLKGYVAEKVARILMQKFPSYQGLVVNLGGDLHTCGVDTDGQSFVFYIDNPVTKKDELVTIQNQSLATSGTYKRQWITEEGIQHHILEKTGLKNPETNIVSASVIHNCGIKSEVYAKILLMLPHNEALKIIDDHTVKYLLIPNTGTVIKNI